MSDAEIAYQIAKERIAKAKASGAKMLSLSPDRDEAWNFKPGTSKALAALATLPPEIASLTEVERLFLSNTQVADLAPLSDMLRLWELDLDNTQVTDLSPLSGLSGLKVLYLDNTQVADVSPLSGLSGLQVLNLANTLIADLSPLLGLSGLQVLSLNNTQADLGGLVRADAAWTVEDLELSELWFKGTPLTAAGEVLDGLYDEGLGIKARTAKALALLRDVRDREPKRPAPAPEQPFVFLSYSRSDSAQAKILRTALESDGITIWQDVDMAIGGRFRAEIMARVDASVAVMTLWSETSVQSDYVTSEAERGREQGKLVPVLLDNARLSPPFDVLNCADLIGWTGDQWAQAYIRLRNTLRDKLTADAPIGAVANKAEQVAPAQRPIGMPPPETDENKRARLIRAQSELTRLIIEELGHETNADARLARRLGRYDAALITDDPLWESIDNAFGSASPLMQPEELDDGLIEAAARWQAAHKALERYINPEQPADAPEPETPDVDPDEGGAALTPLDEVAAMMEAMPAAFTPEAPAFLRENRAQIAAAIEEGPDSAAEDALPRQRKWIGRSLYAATGFLGAVGSVATTLTWAATAQGQAFMAKLGEVWAALMKLLY